MEVFNYYVMTLGNAGTKLGPIVLGCIAVYFIFFRSSSSSKSEKLVQTKADTAKPSFIEIAPQETEKDHEQDEAQKAEYQERLNKARAAREKERAKIKLSPSEVLFDIKPGQILNKKVLKKRYHDLLKENHPDKVDALGSDFKSLAEKKTKEINSAYEELKKKAS